MICHDGLSCAAYAALCLLSWYGAGRGVRKVCVWAVVTPCRDCGVRWNGWDVRSRNVRGGSCFGRLGLETQMR